MRKRRSCVWKNVKEVVNLSGMFDVKPLSLESSDKN